MLVTLISVWLVLLLHGGAAPAPPGLNLVSHLSGRGPLWYRPAALYRLLPLANRLRNFLLL